MRNVKTADKAWIAGVFDARGGFRVSQAKHKRSGLQIRAAIQSSEHALLYEMSMLTGSKRTDREGGKEFFRKQCQAHCPDKHVHYRENATSRLDLQGVSAAILIYNLLPYLRVKREDAKEAYGLFMTNPPGLSGRGAKAVVECVERMRALGWRIPPEFARKAD